MTRQEELQAALEIVADYFPAAIVQLARVCRAGNMQHNGGAPVLFWDRSKSSDHFTKGIRHWTRRGSLDDDDTRHVGKAAWRALADLQIEEEKDGAPLCPAAARAPRPFPSTVLPHDVAAAAMRDLAHHATEAPMPAYDAHPPFNPIRQDDEE